MEEDDENREILGTVQKQAALGNTLHHKSSQRTREKKISVFSVSFCGGEIHTMLPRFERCQILAIYQSGKILAGAAGSCLGIYPHFPQKLYLGLAGNLDVQALQNLSLRLCHLGEDMTILAGVLHFG